VIYNLSTALWEKTPKALKDTINKLNLKTVTVEKVKDKHNRLITTATIYVTTIFKITRVYQHIQNWVNRTVNKSFKALIIQQMI